MSLIATMELLFDRAVALTPNEHFDVDHDPDWPSECEFSPGCWRPVRQLQPISFDGLSHALDTTIHPDIVTYYATFWSGSIETNSSEANEGHVSLIQLWNPEDFERLVRNLIGHALMKRRDRQPLTVFFANTEADSECFLSIENETGRVLLEEPGRVLRVIAEDLSQLLSRLTPVHSEPGIY